MILHSGAAFLVTTLLLLKLNNLKHTLHHYDSSKPQGTDSWWVVLCRRRPLSIHPTDPNTLSLLSVQKRIIRFIANGDELANKRPLCASLFLTFVYLLLRAVSP